jgi:hypothetical protein
MEGLRTRFTRCRLSREFDAPPHEAARPDGSGAEDFLKPSPQEQLIC